MHKDMAMKPTYLLRPTYSDHYFEEAVVIVTPYLFDQSSSQLID